MHISIQFETMLSIIMKCALFSFITITAFSQDYVFPKDMYRSEDNPFYWKNRPPFPGYWQQDIHYTIIATLNDSTDIVSGEEILDYYNNSPDTLNYVYFHLYSNAQNRHSYYTSLYLNNGIKPKFGKYESQDSGCAVTNINVKGIPIKTEVDNTVMKAFLTQSLFPGDKITFRISFRTFFDNGGTVRNRMKMFIPEKGFKHFDVVHWYPRICVYDKKFGWDVEQHLAHEFYGDFGTYDVAFTLPNNYVVDATGILLNRDEVMPDSLRRKLDIRNFRTKPWGSPSSVIIKRNNIPNTWLFHALNVHDFALTADPTYRIGEVDWKGIRCIALAEEPHAAGWQNAAEYTSKVIEMNSLWFGMFGYPKIIVADARDGMEYPMLTLDGGSDPGYRTTLAHEISHNWFFGMVGSNETYRAALDEGFTQFAESWTYKQIDGPYEVEPPFIIRKGLNGLSDQYIEEYKQPQNILYNEVYQGYLLNYNWGIADFTDNIQGKITAFRGSANYGISDVTLNTSSDYFQSALGHEGGYSQVYFKTAVMLYNLQYVLGDSLFWRAMQHYFNQWKFCHPYLNDFRNSITQYTHTDLTWFFDEWLNTSKALDYGIKSIKKDKTKDRYVITFIRKGEMQMPIDFTVVSNTNKVYSYYIPNSWFQKQTTATILPRWIGWGKIEPEYNAIVTIPGGIKKVMIDSTLRLADINMLNNSSPRQVKYYYDSKLYQVPDWTNYEMFYRPALWYNGYDGLQLGIHIRGDYMLFLKNINASLLFNTGAFQLLKNDYMTYAHINDHQNVAFNFDYQTNTSKFIPNSSFNYYMQSMVGLDKIKILFQQKDNSKKYTFYEQLQGLYRPHSWDTNYLIFPEYWKTQAFNNTIAFGIKKDYRYSPSGNGSFELHFRTSAFTQDYSFSQTGFTTLNDQQLGRKMSLHLRFFVQYGTGTNTPYESALYLAGANPEELEDNPFTQAQGFIPQSQGRYSEYRTNFQEGGGLNLRGYAGNFVYQHDAKSNITQVAYAGTSGTSINGELDFNRFVHFNPSFLKNTFALRTYLFGDAGIISLSVPYTFISNNQPMVFSNIIADAGVGATLTIQRWGPLQMIKPITFRFDMPLFLNRLPYTDKSYVQFRWVAGFGKSF